MKKIFLTLIGMLAIQAATAQSNTNRANTDSQTSGQSRANTTTIRQTDENVDRTSGTAQPQTVTRQPINTSAADTKNNRNTSPTLSGNNRSAGNLSSEKNTVSDPTGTGNRNNGGAAAANRP